MSALGKDCLRTPLPICQLTNVLTSPRWFSRYTHVLIAEGLTQIKGKFVLKFSQWLQPSETVSVA